MDRRWRRTNLRGLEGSHFVGSNNRITHRQGYFVHGLNTVKATLYMD
jgi:hypothetical protein